MAGRRATRSRHAFAISTISGESKCARWAAGVSHFSMTRKRPGSDAQETLGAAVVGRAGVEPEGHDGKLDVVVPWLGIVLVGAVHGAEGSGEPRVTGRGAPGGRRTTQCPSHHRKRC